MNQGRTPKQKLNGGQAADEVLAWLPGSRVVHAPDDAAAPPDDAEVFEDRRSGKDRRGLPAIPQNDKEWHTLYARIFRLEPLCTYVENESKVPVPAADFSRTEHKLQVLLSVHDNIREAIQRWEDRIFQAFMISAGAVLSALVFFVENRDKLRTHPALIALAVGAFGISAWWYLYLAARAHARNGVVVAKLEAALGLCQRGVFVRRDRFFGYSGTWEADWRTPLLLAIHFFIVLGSALMIAFY
jgi:hypothetical protein